jgi:hypothetical protein
MAAHDARQPSRGPAGLYRATIERHDRRRADAGWIVLADGSQRGNVNEFMESDIEVITKPAPALDPFRATVAIRDGTSNT